MTTEEKILSILKAANITSVISIDDDWNKREDNLDNITVYDYCETKHIELDGVIEDAIDSLLADKDRTLSNLIVQYRSALRRGDRTVHGVDTIINSVEATHKAISQLNNVKTLLSKLHELDPGLNIEKMDTTPIEFEKTNCLYILDRIGIDRSDKSIDAVPSILRKIHPNIASNDLIIVYTNQIVCNDDCTSTQKLEYLGINSSADISTKMVIHRFREIEKTFDLAQYEVFCGCVLDAIRKSLYGSLIRAILHNNTEYRKRAHDKLLDINVESLIGSIKDIFIEGNSFAYALPAFLNRLEEMEKQKIYIENDPFSIKTFKEMAAYEKAEAQIALSSLSPITNSAYNKFCRERNIEKKRNITRDFDKLPALAIVDSSINYVYDDVTTGDIFHLVTFPEGVSYYAICISQACDCMLRYNDGYNRKLTKFSLCIFETQRLMEFEAAQNSKISDIVFVRDGEGIFALDTTKEREIMDIPCSVIDLCTLNKQGVASIELSEYADAVKMKPYFSKCYYDNLFECGNKSVLQAIFANLDERLQIMSAPYMEGSQNSPMTEELRKVFTNMLVSSRYRLNFSNTEFSLRRLGRLEQNRASALVNSILSKHSRAAVEQQPMLIVGNQ